MLAFQWKKRVMTLMIRMAKHHQFSECCVVTCWGWRNLINNYTLIYSLLNAHSWHLCQTEISMFSRKFFIFRSCKSLINGEGSKLTNNKIMNALFDLCYVSLKKRMMIDRCSLLFSLFIFCSPHLLQDNLAVDRLVL